MQTCSRLFVSHWVLLCAVAVGLVGSGVCTRAADLQVFAAASLTDVLGDLARRYEAQSTDHLLFNFAGSSTLEQQIAAGAPADLFFSADEAKMDMLEKRGLLVAGTRRRILSNQLVVVVPADSKLVLASAYALTNAAVHRLALAEPQTVPAGIYAREYLQKLRLWKALKPKVIPTENVRAALAAVASGNVEAGMVYRTDAGISKRVKIAVEVPLQDGPRISYPVALLQGSDHLVAAAQFEHFLASAEARRVFRRYGFLTLPRQRGLSSTRRRLTGARLFHRIHEGMSSSQKAAR